MGLLPGAGEDVNDHRLSALRSLINVTPSDPTLRLVLADYLEERGEGEAAAFWRWTVDEGVWPDKPGNKNISVEYRRYWNWFYRKCKGRPSNACVGHYYDSLAERFVGRAIRCSGRP